MIKTKADILKAGIKKYFNIDIKKTAEYCKTNFKSEMDETITLADKICDNAFIFNLNWDMEQTHFPVKFQDDINWEFQPADDIEWIYALNRHRYWISLGQAFSLTNDKKYAQTFVNQIIHWIANTSPKQNSTTWRTLEAGLRCEYWIKALVHFIDCPILTDDVLEKIYDSLIEHAEYIKSADRPFATISNWGVIENHGLINVGVVLNIKSYIETAMKRLKNQARTQIMLDGTHTEQSPMYHNEVLHCFLDSIMIAKKTGISFSDDFMKLIYQSALVNLKWKKPNHKEIAQGDSDDFDLRDSLTLSAYVFHDGILKFGGYDKLDFTNVWELENDSIEKYNNIKIVEPQFISSCLNDSGNYYLRSDWSQKANMLHFSCGTIGGGHGHNEKLHIDISAMGEDVLVDSGRFTYVGKPERFEFKSAFAHNTVVVDNEDFIKCNGSWGYDKYAIPTLGKSYSDERYDFIEGGHLGYIDKGVYINRKVVFIKPNIYLVCDEIYSWNPHQYTTFAHFNNEGEVSLNNNIATYTSKNAIVNFHMLNYDKLSIIDTRLSKYYNKVENNKTLKAECFNKKNSFQIFVVDINDKNNPQKAIVECLNTQQYMDEDISIVKISKGGKEFIVSICHNECLNGINLVSIEDYQLRGNVVVASSLDQYKCGTVLKN